MGKYGNDHWNKSGGMRSGFNYWGARNLASKVISYGAPKPEMVDG